MDPDAHSGLVEWAIVATLAFVSLTSAALARLAWSHPHPAR
jgi:hypothetical protein